jgi:hypothetical protein
MELLVFVRNYGGPAGATYVGASVGSAPMVDHPEACAPLTSFAEFRVDADVLDPVAELRETVHEAFAVIEPERQARPVYFARSFSAVRLLLEPGFDRVEDVVSDLAEMLALCSPRAGRHRPLKRPYPQWGRSAEHESFATVEADPSSPTM